jgi:hypothetical protein
MLATKYTSQFFKPETTRDSLERYDTKKQSALKKFSDELFNFLQALEALKGKRQAPFATEELDNFYGNLLLLTQDSKHLLENLTYYMPIVEQLITETKKLSLLETNINFNLEQTKNDLLTTQQKIYRADREKTEKQDETIIFRCAYAAGIIVGGLLGFIIGGPIGGAVGAILSTFIPCAQTIFISLLFTAIFSIFTARKEAEFQKQQQKLTSTFLKLSEKTPQQKAIKSQTAASVQELPQEFQAIVSPSP